MVITYKKKVSLRTGQREEEAAVHLTSRISLILMKGMTSQVLNRIPDHALDKTTGFQ